MKTLKIMIIFTHELFLIQSSFETPKIISKLNNKNQDKNSLIIMKEINNNN